MPEGEAESPERIRTAEVIGTLCLATDLGMGFPFEHGLHTTLIASRLADRLGVDADTASATYYACLLAHAGCTADAHVTAEIFGGSLTTHLHPVVFGPRRAIVAGLVRALPEPERPAPLRAAQVARRLPKAAREQRPHLTAMCEVAEMMADESGLPPAIGGLLAYMTDRWDGKGPLGRAAGEEIPLAMRIVHVAVDATTQRMLQGEEHVARVLEERAGTGLDPAIVSCLSDDPGQILALDDELSAWEETLASEPGPHLSLEGERMDRALAAVGAFADLTSPYFAGHSAAVTELARAAAEHCRLDPAATATVRRAAALHDIGRVAIPPGIWQKPGPLSADDWEQVRLYPYHTERVLSRSALMASLAPVAGATQERLDGSGYHRGVGGADLGLQQRLLAAADVYRALTEPRAHREALPPERAAEVLGDEANAGRLDPDAVAAVTKAAGQRVPRIERPAGLTEREAEVLAALARGLQTKQVAHTLGISVKTADNHIQSVYGKVGVSTRAAATLFAMQHGLVSWGELPIAQPESPA